MPVLAAFLLAFAAAAPEAAAPRQLPASGAGTTVTATARLVHGQRATADAWNRVAGDRKRDVVMRDASGQWFRARLIENE